MKMASSNWKWSYPKSKFCLFNVIVCNYKLCKLLLISRYPFEPPRVTFVTPVYHPNIDSKGRICLDILKMPPTGAWKPLITLEGVLVSIHCLMKCPNPNDPLESDIVCRFIFMLLYFNIN